LKFGSEPVKQGSDFGAEGVLRPRDELTPMIFGVFPQDFDHVEFWTVWRQIDQGGIVHGEPAGGDFVVKPMMNFGVIKNDEGGLIKTSIRSGSLIHSDGSPAYLKLKDNEYEHRQTVHLGSTVPAHESMPGVHRVASLLQR
jgi:hypothetical protein